MAQWIKQSTAITVAIGPFLDSTDGNTVESALTLTQPDIRLSKNGAAFAQKNAAQTLSHMENGYYSLSLDATDTNTLGRLTVHVHETGALPVWHEFMVVPANVWDSMFGADALQVDVAQWLGTAAATPTTAGVPEVDVTHWIGTAAATPTTAGVPEVDVTYWAGALANALVSGRVDASVGAMAAAVITAAAVATGAVDADAVATDAVNEIADGLLARALAAEGYAADGAVPTLSQMLYMLWAALSEFAISGTTITVKKLDGTTTAMTFTLDSATSPTSRTRAT